MVIELNLYACALCEKAFPKGKLLQAHINDNHSSVRHLILKEEESIEKTLSDTPSLSEK